jgi:hypothetical protein
MKIVGFIPDFNPKKSYEGFFNKQIPVYANPLNCACHYGLNCDEEVPKEPIDYLSVSKDSTIEYLIDS